ncbi:MAG: 50S ribosomal protein L25/general stress protein Ctc [Gammaproteobacteria bacterium]|nr:50S ribosomal protein L25/general stress protein Ctc [Gammaproteobacteria bacterium]
MATSNLELSAQPRADLGKGASRRLRRANKVPAVLYGGGGEPQNLEFGHDQIWLALAHESTYARILNITVGKDPIKAVLKDVQRHPYRAIIMHLDLQRVNENEKLHMHVPLHFLNQDTAPGVKDGGIVSHHLSDVEVVCLPKDLPEFIEVDVGGVEMDGVLHLSNLNMPAGVQVVQLTHGHGHEHDLPVVSIHRPRVVVEEAPVAAAPAEGAAAAAPAAAEKPEKK